VQRACNRQVVILIVDDDPGDQELLRRSLETSEHRLTTRIVEDGEEALDYLMQRDRYQDPALAPRPDLVLLDLNMPRADGRQVLKAIRETPSLASLPVIVMTTSSRMDDIQDCYALGASSFITKPSKLDDFNTIVRSVESYWLTTVQLPSGASAYGYQEDHDPRD
jgi:CheY-like chemotaxis protein